VSRVLKPCGTSAAYRRHQMHGEKPCQDCTEAWRAYQRAYYRVLRPNARYYRRKGTVSWPGS